MLELISTLLFTGATISAGTLVSEVTKDCYSGLKAKVAELFGPPALDNLVLLEQQPTDAAARNAITTALGQATPAQLAALTPLIDVFKHALAQDDAARRLAHERGRIDLTLNIDGNITIARLENVSGIGICANAGGDFSLSDINMARSTSAGN